MGRGGGDYRVQKAPVASIYWVSHMAVPARYSGRKCLALSLWNNTLMYIYSKIPCSLCIIPVIRFQNNVMYSHVRLTCRFQTLIVYSTLQFDIQVCLFLARQPQWAMASSFTRFLRLHSDTPHSVGLLWTSDQLVAETSTWQHTTLTTDKHPCPPGGIRTHNPRRRAAADPRLRARGHWDRPMYTCQSLIMCIFYSRSTHKCQDRWRSLQSRSIYKCQKWLYILLPARTCKW
jgi:hypothetical protein